MTESQWAACGEPVEMLGFVHTPPAPSATDADGGALHPRYRASNRKLRLFSCGCCRLPNAPPPDTAMRQALEFVERAVDERIVFDENLPLYAAWQTVSCPLPQRTPASALWWRVAWLFDRSAYGSAHRELTDADIEPLRDLKLEADLLRDLFGPLPFRPAPLDPAWLAWNDGAVKKMARVVYDERRFADLPILADALEDAGCDCRDLLDHCRGGGFHARGCWVVDLLLGME